MRRVLPRHSRGRLGSHKAVVTWFSPRAVPVQESVPVWFAAPHSRRQSSSRRSQMSSSCCSESCAEGVASWGPSSRPRGGVALAPSRSSARALRSSSSRVPAGLSLSLGSLLLFLSTGGTHSLFAGVVASPRAPPSPHLPTNLPPARDDVHPHHAIRCTRAPPPSVRGRRPARPREWPFQNPGPSTTLMYLRVHPLGSDGLPHSGR
jgi:hypothetical protein